MDANTLDFIFHGQTVKLPVLAPDTTLLQFLREHMHHSACKEGCGEGDCGACTVVLAKLNPQGGLSYQAVNACIRMAHAIHGQALWTAAGIKQEDGRLHPVQQALVDHHASQCGFCTPGFVMSLFAYYQNTVLRDITPTRLNLEAALDGNLCRCTGYQSILQAGLHLNNYPKVKLDETTLIVQLKAIATHSNNKREQSYMRPQTLTELLRLRQQYPKAQLLAGGTDLGLWITKGGRNFSSILDLSECAQLQMQSQDAQGLHLGAALSLEQAFTALSQIWPDLKPFFRRFAGRPIRNAGTLGGNIANGSPIGDSMPVLLALDADITLIRQGSNGLEVRRLALADFYTGYRQNQMRPDEILSQIHIPTPLHTPHVSTFLRAYKVSKRMDDDISAVCFAMRLVLNAQSVVQQACIGLGGVAATPVRAYASEALLQGQTWGQTVVQAAQASLQTSFHPISDMRASAAYRSAMLEQLLQRFYLESLGQTDLHLSTLAPSG